MKYIRLGICLMALMGLCNLAFAQARNLDYTRWESDYAFATENDSLHDYIVFFPGKVVFSYSNELQQYDIGEYSISHDTCTAKYYADERRPFYCDGYYDTIKRTYLVSENELTLVDVPFHWIVKNRYEGGWNAKSPCFSPLRRRSQMAMRRFAPIQFSGQQR